MKLESPLTIDVVKEMGHYFDKDNYGILVCGSVMELALRQIDLKILEQ